MRDAILAGVNLNQDNFDEMIEEYKLHYNTNKGEYNRLNAQCNVFQETIDKNSNIYPLSSVRGFVPQNSIYKKRGEVAEKR